MRRKTRIVTSMVLLLALTAAVVSFRTATASNTRMTIGNFQTLTTGVERGIEISGRAQMVRTADGKTLTIVQAWGLAANTTYPVHVHNAPCASTPPGGGHYQNVVGGPVDAVNEIWPGFETNANGHGSGYAANEFTARPEAQSVVIHDTDGARLACADLN